MPKTARFDVLRQKTLKRLFTPENLASIWRSIVKKQMRSLDIQDLHDYYDFNFAIEERSAEICHRVLRGQYKPSSPLIYRLEKLHGICRHLMIPSPSDALVFQTIAEYLQKPLKEAQPTTKAYYSRDKHELKLPHQFGSATAYPWFVLWPRFQQEILKFSGECNYLVVTDLTNYFDNIGLRELRHIVSSTIKVEEVVLDLLFTIIDQISWIPDYLPISLKGLPTINLEAFRLLPHVMLFEVDAVLNKQTNGNFVRWMDDINFGVDSLPEAYRILGSVNDVLKSRGLALNISKTKIYSSREAQQHFLFYENKFLDEFAKKDPESPNFLKDKKRFMKRFRNHLKTRELRNWDKVTKRYFTVAGRLGISDLRRYVRKLFLEIAGIRPNILYYLSLLGFSSSTARIITDLMGEVPRYDDVTLIGFCRLLTNMKIPMTKRGADFLSSVNAILKNWKGDFELYCYLWFSAKYREPFQLANLIQESKNRWMNELFLARQVVTVLPRLIQFNREMTVRLINEQMVRGPRDAASVASNILSLIEKEKIEKRLYAYMFPPKPQRPYPMPKFLILLAVASSQNLQPSPKKTCARKAREQINDPWYLHWIGETGLFK